MNQECGGAAKLSERVLGLLEPKLGLERRRGGGPFSLPFRSSQDFMIYFQTHTLKKDVEN